MRISAHVFDVLLHTHRASERHVCIGSPVLHDCHTHVHKYLLACRWLAIEQHKLAKIDTSWADALAAAKEAGAADVVYKLEALIGVKLPHLGAAGGLAPAAAAAAVAAGSNSAAADLGAVAAITQNFCPDLALKQELHDIKVKKRQRLANLQLPVPTPSDTARAVAAGVVPSSSSSGSINTGAYGTRQFGIPDPTCGAVPEGCVAIRCVRCPQDWWFGV